MMLWRTVTVFTMLICGTISNEEYGPEDVEEMLDSVLRNREVSRDKRDTGNKLYPDPPPPLPVEDVWYDQSYFENIYDQLTKIGVSGRARKYSIYQLKRVPSYNREVQNCTAKWSIPNCNPSSVYRTYDGTCNNLENPTWGAVQDCLQRLLPASYNGAAGLRTSVTGGPLPEPRDLSLNINTDKDRPTRTVSNLFTIFGQALAHDMAHSTPQIGPGLLIECCPIANASDFRCMGIPIRPDDPFYSKRNITCINFSREQPCRSCEVEQRKLPNTVTTPIDLSIVYGVTEEEALGLRRNDGTGKMNSRMIDEGEIPPANELPALEFCTTELLPYCFRTGDSRANQHTLLSTMHTLFLREHNRIADGMKTQHPDWNDEELYQTARRILGAMMQAIVFKEYLPNLLGPVYMSRYGLRIGKKDSRTVYDPTIRYGILTEHETGAFRIHSMISSVTGFQPFHTLYSNPNPIYQSQIPQMLSGLCRTASQMFDRYLVKDTTDLLYQLPGDDYGLDMASVDIQRGRDHGVPRYVDMVEYCYRTRITTFDQLRAVMSKKNAQLLRNNYKSVADVDLWIGMQMEPLAKGSVLSKTAACISAEQFFIAKYGDRFYLEHANEVPSFTTAQLESLKKTSLSRMLCDNTNITEVQYNSLLLSSSSNPVLQCNKLQQVDLSLF